MGAAVVCGIVDLGIGAPLNSTTAGAEGSGPGLRRPLITSSETVGILKFGALGIGRGTDSD